MKPIRSALYIPADHARAMAKASTLAADALIFDLEDGVSEAHKQMARDALCALFAHSRPTQRCIVRINHLHTTHYQDDLRTIARLPVDGMMLSKVADHDEIEDAIRQLAPHGRADVPIWCNVETPAGFMTIHSIAGHASVVALAAGTNDLANDLRIIRTPDRQGLMQCLQSLVLAARAYGKTVLDGTFVDLEDEAGLRAEAAQGRMLGFDGKTLIHPKQINAVNATFSPTPEEIETAKQVIIAYETALKDGKAVTLLDGRMIEALHYRRAKETLGI